MLEGWTVGDVKWFWWYQWALIDPEGTKMRLEKDWRDRDGIEDARDRQRLWDKFLKAANRFHLMTEGRQIIMAEDA